MPGLCQLLSELQGPEAPGCVGTDNQLSLCLAACRAVFAFSTELLKAARSEQDGYLLQPTGRYAHSPAYLRRVAAATGWNVQLLQEAQIRQNAGQPILGNLCILQRK
jgi:predicted TPR repeat methyltransferase